MRILYHSKDKKWQGCSLLDLSLFGAIVWQIGGCNRFQDYSFSIVDSWYIRGRSWHMMPRGCLHWTYSSLKSRRGNWQLSTRAIEIIDWLCQHMLDIHFEPWIHQHIYSSEKRTPSIDKNIYIRDSLLHGFWLYRDYYMWNFYTELKITP